MKERNSDSKKQENLHSGQNVKNSKKAPITGAFSCIAFISKKWYNISKLKKKGFIMKFNMSLYRFVCYGEEKHIIILPYSYVKTCPHCYSKCGRLGKLSVVESLLHNLNLFVVPIAISIYQYIVKGLLKSKSLRFIWAFTWIKRVT